MCIRDSNAATNSRKFNAILATASINNAIEYYNLFKEIQKLQGIAGSPAPIGGTLVAGSVLVIHAEKEISGFHHR